MVIDFPSSSSFFFFGGGGREEGKRFTSNCRSFYTYASSIIGFGDVLGQV